MLSGSGGAIRLSVSPEGKMEIVVPERGDGGENSGRRAYEHGGGLDDGAWHTIRSVVPRVTPSGPK